MGMQEGRARLGKSVKDLQARWRETRTHWDDSTAKAFEMRRLVDIEMDARAAVSAMDSMAAVLQQIRRDCE
jgi:hypothetical protein